MTSIKFSLSKIDERHTRNLQIVKVFTISNIIFMVAVNCQDEWRKIDLRVKVRVSHLIQSMPGDQTVNVGCSFQSSRRPR